MEAKDKIFSAKKTLNIRGHLFSLATPRVMGILNITEDSFFDGGRFTEEKAMLQRVEKMIGEGADIIDIGAYSSRPGAAEVPEKLEQERIQHAVSAVSSHFGEIPISVDTFRSSVAAVGMEEGGGLINDIAAGALDDQMFETVARYQVPYILMHMRGTPATMQSMTDYTDIIKEIAYYFSEKIVKIKALGINDWILDPGFGFAKTLAQNYELAEKLDQLQLLEAPLLVGVSRKSMLYKLLGITAAEALNATTALHMACLQKGANILRVHDVLEAKQTIRIFEQMKEYA